LGTVSGTVVRARCKVFLLLVLWECVVFQFDA